MATNGFQQFIRDNRWLIVSYLIWFFIHFILLMSGNNGGVFYPFDGFKYVGDYGFFEFAVYLMLPILVFIIWKLVGQDIKQKIDENK
ncbi:MAG: hypothetical protein KDC60_04060 [Bacteroidetes bacterium]|nr:hypothetical protein [Bacteroidota bacterium]